MGCRLEQPGVPGGSTRVAAASGAPCSGASNMAAARDRRTVCSGGTLVLLRLGRC